jgi:hypothetical protein
MEKQTYYKIVINAKNERIQYVVGGFDTKEKATEFAVNNDDLFAFVVSEEEVFELMHTVFDLRKKQSRFSGIPFYSPENFPAVRW